MQPSITLRPYQPSDADAIVTLTNADALQTCGAPRAVIDAVGNPRLTRYVPPSAERMVATNARGRVVGYSYLVQRDHPAIREIGGAVDPAWWGHGVASLLLDWAEERVHTLATQRGDGIRSVLQTNLFEQETVALQLVRERGFEQVREWSHFVRDLEIAPTVPALPEGLSIRTMDLDHDWDLVGPAMDAAFSNHWGAIVIAEPAPAAEEEPTDGADVDDPPTDDTYSNSPGFCFCMLDGAVVIGGVLCNAKLVERSDTGRVGSIFVHPSYQRRGVGRALMLRAFRAFWDHGVRRIILDTDAESFSDSPAFYGALGMRWYRREWLYEKQIRPGHEARRLWRV
jgi:mycothiol synthase